MRELLGPVVPSIDRVVFPFAVRVVTLPTTSDILSYWPRICRQPHWADGKGIIRLATDRQRVSCFMAFAKVPPMFCFGCGITHPLTRSVVANRLRKVSRSFLCVIFERIVQTECQSHCLVLLVLDLGFLW